MMEGLLESAMFTGPGKRLALFLASKVVGCVEEGMAKEARQRPWIPTELVLRTASFAELQLRQGPSLQHFTPRALVHHFFADLLPPTAAQRRETIREACMDLGRAIGSVLAAEWRAYYDSHPFGRLPESAAVMTDLARMVADVRMRPPGHGALPEPSSLGPYGRFLPHDALDAVLREAQRALPGRLGAPPEVFEIIGAHP